MTEIGVEVKRCIYRVPGWLKDQMCDGNDKTPYEPEFISFGPYHWGKEEVKEMEQHKERCLRKMLKREKQHIDDYLKEMRNVEEDVRACYQGWCKDIESEVFVKMLVLDGCFMLEFLRVNKLGLNALDYDDNDPVFSKDSIMHVIARDMIKLENQLPLMVLEKLLSLQYKQPIKNRKHIPKIVMRALTPIWITNQILSEDQLKPMWNAVARLATTDPNNTMLHCLDIFRSSLLYKPPDDQVPIEDATGPANMILHCLKFFRSRLLQKPPEDQERAQVKITDIANPIQIPTQVNDMSVPGQEGEEQSDPEMGWTLSLDQDSFDISASASSVPNERSCSPDHSSSDEQEEELTDIENRPQPKSCLSDVQTRIMNCLQRPNKVSDEIEANSMLMVYCVEDLIKAGVKFKKRKSQPFWDLKFDTPRGVLEIPTIKIDDASKTVFLNLIAYEQCHLREFWEMSITDYVAFMDNLVNSASDVRHLHQAGIIVHQLGNDEEVADLFNRLVKKAFVSWKEGHLSELYIDLNRYCSHKRHRWSASWRNDYLKNPWVIISVIAAILLFGATLVQTVFTVFPYYKPAR